MLQLWDITSQHWQATFFNPYINEQRLYSWTSNLSCYEGLESTPEQYGGKVTRDRVFQEIKYFAIF